MYTEPRHRSRSPVYAPVNQSFAGWRSSSLAAPFSATAATNYCPIFVVDGDAVLRTASDPNPICCLCRCHPPPSPPESLVPDRYGRLISPPVESNSIGSPRHHRSNVPAESRTVQSDGGWNGRVVEVCWAAAAAWWGMARLVSCPFHLECAVFPFQ